MDRSVDDDEVGLFGLDERRIGFDFGRFDDVALGAERVGNETARKRVRVNQEHLWSRAVGGMSHMQLTGSNRLMSSISFYPGILRVTSHLRHDDRTRPLLTRGRGCVQN